MNLSPTLRAGIPVMLLCLCGCGFVGLDELPTPDAGNADAARSDASVALDSGRDGSATDVFQADVPSDAARPDAGTDAPLPMDGGSDAGRDAGIDAGTDAGMDAGRDAGTDAGGCSPPRWGVSDDDTSDVAGDDFGRQVWTLRLCSVPALGEQVPLHFRARITVPGTMHSHDTLAPYIYINGAGGNNSIGTWTPERVEGDTFIDYTLLLPADIDDDGVVDWVVGDNELDLETWSNYNARYGKTGIDSLVLMWP